MSDGSVGQSPQLDNGPKCERCGKGDIVDHAEAAFEMLSKGARKCGCCDSRLCPDVTALRPCPDVTAFHEKEFEDIKTVIHEYNVSFYRCACEPQLWAMNWRGRKPKPTTQKSGAFKPLGHWTASGSKKREKKGIRALFRQIRQKALKVAVQEEPEELEEGIGEGGSGKRVWAPENGAAGGEGCAKRTRVSFGSAGASSTNTASGVAPTSRLPEQAPAASASTSTAGSFNDVGMREILQRFPWTENLLTRFLQTEQQSLVNHPCPEASQRLSELEGNISSISRRAAQHPNRTDFLKKLLDTFGATLLPYDVRGTEKTLTTVKDVLVYAIGLFPEQPRLSLPLWDQALEIMDELAFVVHLEGILWALGVAPGTAGVLPGSMAVFFRMPSWVAKLVLYIIKRDEGVRDQVAALGYRAFALVGRAEVLPFNPSLFGGTFSGMSGAMGEGTYEGSFSLICGYNIRQCPAWVGQDGISLVDGFSPHLHRNLVDRLSREYYERVESAFDSVEDSDSEVSSEMPGGEGDNLEIASQTASRAQSRSSSLSRHSTPAAHGEAAKPMGFPGAANPFAVEAKDEDGMAMSQTVDPGHEREFDAFKKLLSTCRAEMAAESELSKHADLMKLVLQEDRFRALYEFSEPRAKGGILKGRGGATRGAAPSDAKGRDRKVLQKHGARGHAHFADTSSAEETADRDVSLVEEDVDLLKSLVSKEKTKDFNESTSGLAFPPVSLGPKHKSRPNTPVLHVEEDVETRPPQTSSSDSSASSESDASSADTARPPRTSSSGSSKSSGSDASSADTVSGEEETAGSELRMEQSCEEELVQRVLEELHDFGASSQWVLQVTVRQHNGKDDDLGERIDSAKIEKEPNFRLYTVDAQQLIKVTLRNLSMSNDIKLLPVYVTDTGEEEPEDMVDLKCCGEEYELPFPLQKKSGEAEDAWAIKDANGRTVLKLRFRVA
eukprot:Tamp_04978.p1 GENE.Tamp_04978~~Tamp_04978.p1  ORF type:complete len:951 (-),score=126.65 Tamp_04978:65-2917(-)